MREGLWHLVLNVPETNECVEWQHTRQAKCGPRQYGQVQYQGKLWFTHRLSFLLHIGELTEGLQVCHRCDNAPCFNPHHLFQGTRIDNMQDSVAKGRNFIPPPSSCRTALLDEWIVREIRYLSRDGACGNALIARVLGIDCRTVRACVSRRTWKNVT